MTHSMEPQPLSLEVPEPLGAAAIDWLERCEMAYGPTTPGPLDSPEISTRYGLALKHLGAPAADYEPHLWSGFREREVTPFNDSVRDFALQALSAKHVDLDERIGLAERILADCNTRGEETLSGQGFAEHVSGRIAEAKGDIEEAAASYSAAQNYFKKARNAGAGHHRLEAHNTAFLTVAGQRLRARQPAGTLALSA